MGHQTYLLLVQILWERACIDSFWKLVAATWPGQAQLCTALGAQKGAEWQTGCAGAIVCGFSGQRLVGVSSVALPALSVQLRVRAWVWLRLPGQKSRVGGCWRVHAGCACVWVPGRAEAERYKAGC